MMLLNILAKLAAYACIGWIVEVLFTGFYSLIVHKNKAAVCKTYLWMAPIYSLAGIIMEGVREALSWPWYLKPLVYVPLIYGIEGLSGWLLRKAIGRCPWEYNHGAWSPFGLITFAYLPFWTALALGFEPVCYLLGRVVEFVGKGY